MGTGSAPRVSARGVGGAGEGSGRYPALCSARRGRNFKPAEQTRPSRPQSGPPVPLGGVREREGERSRSHGVSRSRRGSADRGGSRRAGGGQGYGDAPEAIARPGHCLPGSSAALTWRSRRQRRSRESARPRPCRQHGGGSMGERGGHAAPPRPLPPRAPAARRPRARPAGGGAGARREAAVGVSMAARAALRALCWQGPSIRGQPAPALPGT